MKIKKFNIYQKSLLIVSIFAFLFGLFIRLKIYFSYTPLGVVGDLTVLQELWNGEFYLRENQYILAVLLAFISSLLSTDFANAAAFLSLCSSIGCMIIIPCIIFNLTKEYSFTAFSIILYSLSSHFIFVTLQTQSESPFLFSLLLSFLLLLKLLNNANDQSRINTYLLALTVLSTALSIGIRPNSLFHIFLFFLIYLLINCLKKNKINRKIYISLLVLPLSILLFFAGKLIFLKTRPEVDFVKYSTPYGKLVIIENLLVNPFSWGEESEAVSYRCKAMKSIKVLKSNDYDFDPEIIDPRKSIFAILWENKKKYIDNVTNGIIETLIRLIDDIQINYFGAIISITGLIIVFGRSNNILIISMIVSWLLVYLIVVPLFITHQRSIWPIGFGFSTGTVFSLGYLFKYCKDFNYLRTIGIVLVLLVMLIEGIKPYHMLWYMGTDSRQVVSDFIDKNSLKSETSVMSSDQGLLSFGQKKSFIPLPYEENTQTMVKYIKSEKPSYIFFLNDLKSIWEKPHATTINAINFLNKDNAKVYDLVFEDSRCSLWQLQR